MCRILISFIGTSLSRAEVIAVLTAVHMTSLSSNIVERNGRLASATVDLRPSKSFFLSLLFHKMTFLRVGLAGYGWCGVSNNTMSWSLFGPSVGDFETWVSIPDLCHLYYFYIFLEFVINHNLGPSMEALRGVCAPMIPGNNALISPNACK